ncbi:MAG: pseudouridine synthase [Candidatus Accumulibacter sp.]|jgi:23S rRNA pseudouridine2605 synthase|nr:pseudouridine synthase [Accumulibacter sp.]
MPPKTRKTPLRPPTVRSVAKKPAFSATPTENRRVPKNPASPKNPTRAPKRNSPPETFDEAPTRSRAKPSPTRSARASTTPRGAAKARLMPVRGAVPAKPELLNKLLALSGAGSRREMARRIEEGRVTVNGTVAEVGQRILPGDRVKLNDKRVNLSFPGDSVRVILYHKPEGEIVSRDDPKRRPTVFASLPRLSGARWVAVGRLDFNTSGLLVFTTSGDLANRLMHPRYQLAREYAVRLIGELPADARKRLLDGVALEDGPARFDTLAEAGGTGVNRWYRVSLSEGRNREVRRLFEAVGLTVSRLIRVRYGPFVLPPGLKRGKVLELDAKTVRGVLRELEGAPQEAEDIRSARPARATRMPDSVQVLRKRKP